MDAASYQQNSPRSFANGATMVIAIHGVADMSIAEIKEILIGGAAE
jgi:phage replication-related protein YjqB (UPF0714/DUF867 family)